MGTVGEGGDFDGGLFAWRLGIVDASPYEVKRDLLGALNFSIESDSGT